MLALEGVCKSYRGRATPVLDSLELHLRAGQVIVLSGASGSGKTTLLSLLTGTQVADGGTVSVFERNVARLRRSSIRHLRRQLGIVPQRLTLLKNRTALENVSLALELHAVSRSEVRSRAKDALDHFELGHLANTKVRKLSLGEQQRVAIARAIVTWPSLLICDEPTAHLDPAAAGKFVQLMDTMQQHQSSILVATNDRQLISAAALRGWHHLQLRHGQLHYADAYDLTAQVDEESGFVEDVADGQIVSTTVAEGSGPYADVSIESDDAGEAIAATAAAAEESGPYADVVPIPIAVEDSDTVPNQIPLAMAAGDH